MPAYASAPGARPDERDSPPLIIASILRPEGSTGVHTHVREYRRYLDAQGTQVTLLTPFSWGRVLGLPVFGLRLGIERLSKPASVAWYRYFHGVFLGRALRRHLRGSHDAVIYAQGPVEAAMALSARHGPKQRVVMAVHFQTSQADEWVRKEQIVRDGPVFRTIRKFEKDVIPNVDGLIYVSKSARADLTSWLPEAALVPSVVIPNFIAAPPLAIGDQLLGDLVSIGGLELAKNHRFLLEVLAVIHKRGRDLTLDIYGDGHNRKDLHRLARSLEIAHLVRFRGYQPDVTRHLTSYRVYVHASYAETSSFAIIEAMSAGLPIVTTRVGGIPEIVTDGVEARMWSPEDPEGAATVLTDFLDDETAYAEASTSSRDRFYRDFSAGVVAPRLHAFLVEGAPFRAHSHPAIPSQVAATSWRLDADPRTHEEQ